MNNIHQSHKLFFRAITEKKLNELLKRADTTTKVLENDINSLNFPILSMRPSMYQFDSSNCAAKFRLPQLSIHYVMLFAHP